MGFLWVARVIVAIWLLSPHCQKGQQESLKKNWVEERPELSEHGRLRHPRRVRRLIQLVVHLCDLLVYLVALAPGTDVQQPESEERVQHRRGIVGRLLADEVRHDVAKSRAYDGHDGERSESPAKDDPLFVPHSEDSRYDKGLVSDLRNEDHG